MSEEKKIRIIRFAKWVTYLVVGIDVTQEENPRWRRFVALK